MGKEDNYMVCIQCGYEEPLEKYEGKWRMGANREDTGHKDK